MKKLLVVSSAPVIKRNNLLELDMKYVEGMRTYSKLWAGPVRGILSLGAKSIPFNTILKPNELPFELILQNSDIKLGLNDIRNFDVILASGDDHQLLYLANLCKKVETKLFYSIENTAETRIQIIFLDSTKSILRKIYSTLWTIRQELRRKSAFRQATGLQANGYPAFISSKKINKNTMLYLDNRMRLSIFASQDDIQAKKKHLTSGKPLRIIHSGRLEKIKGAQDLIPIAQRLVSHGVNFQLDIYGTGSLEKQISQDIIATNLQDNVFLHNPVDFESQLVPISNKESDVFLSCHRQSDPSCTYLECMASGLAIFGYRNRMLSELLDKSNAGWAVPLGNVNSLADAIIKVDKDRSEIVDKCQNALEFAKLRNFDSEFERRINHIATSL